MNIQKISFYLLLALSLGWMSCTDEDPVAELPADFENGVLVLNEGGFGAATASLSFYETNADRVWDFVYSIATGEAILGDVLQSASIADDNLYMVVNGSGKLISSDIKSKLKTNYVIEGLEQPRYMATSGKKGYLSNWVSSDKDGYISLIDLEAGTAGVKIPMGNQPEAVLITDGKLFVSNQGSNNIFVVSLATEKVTDTIAVGTSPNGLVLDAEGDLWVMCAGAYQENNGALYEINTKSLSMTKEIQLEKNTSGKIAVSPSGDKIYYYSGTDVYAFSTSATTPPTEALISESNALGFYGIGVSPEGIIYLADAKDYVQSGEAFRYQVDGTFINKFTVGLIPNGFVFN